MTALGFNEAQIEQYRRNHTPDHFDVLEENWAALTWFLEVDDLFNIEQGIVIGLDVTAIRNDAEMSGRQIDPDTYQKLRILGRTAAAELNRKAK